MSSFAVSLAVAFGIGFLAAAPIGPVNVLVIRRALLQGRSAALLLGVGAALADAVVAGICVFGFGAVLAFVRMEQDVLRLFAGLLMLGFAVVLLRSHPGLAPQSGRSSAAAQGLVAIFLMTLSNPATLFWFVAAFQAIGLRHSVLPGTALILATGLGSLAWWLIIVHFAVRFRSKLSDVHLRRINFAAAIVMAVSGIATFVAGLH